MMSMLWNQHKVSPLFLVISSVKRYHTNVIDHYENPRNIGSLDKNNNNVGTGLVGAPACGDVMRLNIMVDDDGIIIDSKFKTFGCGSAIASSSVITEWVKNKHINDAYLITNKEIARELKLPPVKLHCSMLAEDAIKSAIKDYLIKNNIITIMGTNISVTKNARQMSFT